MIQPLWRDRVFEGSPDAGDPTCLCSRCLQLIREDQIPIRLLTANKKKEWRYHPECLGVIVGNVTGP